MASFIRNDKTYIFANQTSNFSKNEHEALNIDLSDTDDFDKIISHGLDSYKKTEYNYNDLPNTLQQLIDTPLTKQSILTFNPGKQPKHISKDVLLFYDKLRMVLWNNSQDMQVTRFEEYLHEFAKHLFYCAELEDGYNLTMVPCNLELTIENHRFAAFADREGRRGNKTIWILDEDKHLHDTWYKDGIIQLVSCLIAAAQKNRANYISNRPKKLIGIIIKGDRINICSVIITDKYLDELTSGIPADDIRLQVIKYPKNKMLSFAKPSDREEIFYNLTALRNYGLSIQPSYDDI